MPFAVDSSGHVSNSPVIISSQSKLVLHIGINLLRSDGSALITDSSFGASIVNVDSKFETAEVHHVSLPNQGAACWATYMLHHDAVYVIDAGHANIALLDPVSGDIKGAIQYETDTMRRIDTIPDRQWLYLLTADTSVVVVDFEDNGGSELQHYSLEGEGQPKH